MTPKLKERLGFEIKNSFKLNKYEVYTDCNDCKKVIRNYERVNRISIGPGEYLGYVNFIVEALKI